MRSALLATALPSGLLATPVEHLLRRLPPFLLIGNPELRRMADFAAALERAGQGGTRVVSHEALIGEPESLLRLPNERLVVRLDATGKNPAVERALLISGYERTVAAGGPAISPEALAELPAATGRVLFPRQHFNGFSMYLERLAAVFEERPAWSIWSPVASILEVFDKRVTSRRYHESGIPAPPALPDVITVGELRRRMDGLGWTSVFVKLACSSSASGLAVLRRRNGGESLMTTLKWLPHGWFNARRIQRLDQPAAIDRALGFLLAEGAQVEQAMVKARLAGAFFDCRVITIGGEPDFVIVRQSRHPVTNLQLGGFRGELAALRAACPAEAFEAAMASCRRVARLHGGFCLGIDVMFEPGWGHRVLEANAFGDWFPGLERAGEGVFDREIAVAAISESLKFG